MARRKGPTPKGRAAPTGTPRDEGTLPTRLLLFLGIAVFLAALGAAFLVSREGGDNSSVLPDSRSGQSGPVHVHGLGINPKDGALFIATHTGMWRVAKGERRASRVTDRTQDTMGFTVVGPDRFLGSGHPDVRENLPPLLGLIESRDAGKSWHPISLLGEADFHVLRSRGKRVYGFDSSNGRLLFSRDRGRTWTERQTPGPLLDLAVDPIDLSHLVATGEHGLVQSRDDGRSWRLLGDKVGLLAWPDASRLYLIDQAGIVSVSRTGGRKWLAVGSIGGQPAALLATRGDLYVALHDGSIKRSGDGGRTWTIRSSAA